MDDAVDLLGDRHVNTQASGQSPDFFGSFDALHDLADFLDRFLDRFAPAQGQAQAAVTGKIAGTGQYQVAHAGQAGQRFFTRTQRPPQAHHFGQTAGHQRRPGVIAQAHTVRHTRCNSEYVFHRAAQFRTHDVITGIDTEIGAMQGAGDPAAVFRVRSRHGYGRRQVGRNLFGKRGAGNHSQGPFVTEQGLCGLMQEATGTGLQALAGPGDALAVFQPGSYLLDQAGKGM